MFARLTHLLPLVAALALAACAPEAPRTRPHVVLIVVDTLRADAILDPTNRYHTPHIDALAADGALFAQAFTHAPMTLPAHTSLFTSRLPHLTGVVNNGQSVPPNYPLLPDWMSTFGYETRAVISLGTLQTPPAGTGLERGFVEYDQEMWRMAPAWHVSKRLTRSLDERDPTRPLFLFAHYSDPHSPVGEHEDKVHADVLLNGEPVDEVVTSQLDIRAHMMELRPGRNEFEFRSETPFKVFGFHVKEGQRRLDPRWEVGGDKKAVKHARVIVERSDDASNECFVRYWLTDWIPNKKIRGRYVQEVQFVDHWVGQLIERLKRDGLYDDALIVFTSDHGESLGEHDYFGHVDYLTDEEIHVPLIVKPPRGERLKELRRRSDGLVRHLDLVPTVLEWCGLPPLPGQQGVNFLREDVPPVLSETHTPQAVKTKVSLRDEHYKLIYVADDERFVMYDLRNDPGETEDCFEERGEERRPWFGILREAARRGGERPQVELSDEVLEDLEALGYVR